MSFLIKTIKSVIERTNFRKSANLLRRSVVSEIVVNEWQKPEAHSGHDTGIVVYNCVHKGTVPLIVRNRQCVTWYTCGPTVYDAAHIGHAVCYMKVDIIQRILRDYFQLNLITAMNVTDIDDKIIARSVAENVPWLELVRKYETDFWSDINALGIQRADFVLRVSDSFPQIIKFIARLLEKNAAYVAADGSVYFTNTQIQGKLHSMGSPSEEFSKLNKSSSNVRKSLSDFALWKATKPHEPSWPVPWRYENDANVSTAGRPGWHTECAAMATDLFGNVVDIHAGGIDLKFPHHENEESQCCSYHDTKQWVNYWLHIGHLVTTNNVKMSKSLKNVISIKEFLSHYSRDQFRIACLISTYHQHIQFDDETMLQAGEMLKRFVSFFDDTEHFLHNTELRHTISNRAEILLAIDRTLEQIDAALKNDFDTRSCLFSLLELVKMINKAIQRKSSETTLTVDVDCEVHLQVSGGLDAIRSGQHIVKRFLKLFGCEDTINNLFAMKLRSSISQSMDGIKSTHLDIDHLVNDIMELRSNIKNDAKATKDKKLFQLSDELRQILRKNRLVVKDHGNVKSTWSFDAVITKKNKKQN